MLDRGQTASNSEDTTNRLFNENLDYDTHIYFDDVDKDYEENTVPNTGIYRGDFRFMSNDYQNEATRRDPLSYDVIDPHRNDAINQRFLNLINNIEWRKQDPPKKSNDGDKRFFISSFPTPVVNYVNELTKRDMPPTDINNMDAFPLANRELNCYNPCGRSMPPNSGASRFSFGNSKRVKGKKC